MTPCIQELLETVRNTPLKIPPTCFWSRVWGEAIDSAELVLRQRLATREKDIISALLIANSSAAKDVCLALPIEWLFIIDEHGYKVDYAKSRMRWVIFIIGQYLFGLQCAAAGLYLILFRRSKCADRFANYIYFCDLQRSNLPYSEDSNDSYCIVNWYVQNYSFEERGNWSIRHSVKSVANRYIKNQKLEYQNFPIPTNHSFIRTIQFIYSLLVLILIASKALLECKWWNVIPFGESVFALLLRVQDSSLIAKEYWFHNSRIFPPLWTYELALKSSRSVYYFYSSNMMPFASNYKTRKLLSWYNISNWPYVLIWNLAQERFLKQSLLTRSQIQLCKPIWFADNTSRCLYNKPYIAIFDVSPKRLCTLASICPVVEYYSPQVWRLFMDDILSIACSLEIAVLYKQKRSDEHMHPICKSYFLQARNKASITFADPDSSPEPIIFNSAAVISMPFTSTAFIAKSYGKDSAFYDPVGYYSPSDYACGGITLLSNKYLLNKWMKSVQAIITHNTRLP